MAIRSNSTVVGAGQPKIQLSLSDRNITWLHSAGVAGLWMTLRQLEQQFPSVNHRPGQLDWSLSSRGVKLNWSGNDLEILDWLLNQSFQINDKGLISLTGLKGAELNTDTQVAIHQGMTATFLQHNKCHKSDGEKQLVLNIDEETITVRYKSLTSYAHQEFAKRLCDERGYLLQKPIRIASWLYPGAVMSYASFSNQTKFQVTPEEALVLLFAPIACWYFMLPSNQHHKKRYALLIPEIRDLKKYAEHDWKARRLSYGVFWAASWGDAGLRFLTLQKDIEQTTTSGVERCQSFLFGEVAWATQQKVRIKAQTIEATEQAISDYQLSDSFFPQNRICEHESSFYVVVSDVRGKIANSLANNLPWWHNCIEERPTANSLKRNSFEREALLKMVEEIQWNDQSKKLFVKACHESLRRIYGKLYSRAPEGEFAQIERCNLRFRSELRRCKNALALRKFISHFFAEAGQVPTLQDHWEELLPITTGEVDWQLTRDLMLLALASYKKSETSKESDP